MYFEITTHFSYEHKNGCFRCEGFGLSSQVLFRTLFVEIHNYNKKPGFLKKKGSMGTEGVHPDVGEVEWQIFSEMESKRCQNLRLQKSVFH